MIFLAFLVWLFGFTMRLIAQTDDAGVALIRREIDHKPPLREFLIDAALWWLWMSFDFGRWIKEKMWK